MPARYSSTAFSTRACSAPEGTPPGSTRAPSTTTASAGRGLLALAEPVHAPRQPEHAARQHAHEGEEEPAEADRAVSESVNSHMPPQGRPTRPWPRGRRAPPRPWA